MFSFSPTIRLSFWISPSVTLAEPELVTVKSTGPAAIDAGCGAQPASERASVTLVPAAWSPEPPEEQAAISPAATTATARAPTTARPRRCGGAWRGESGDTAEVLSGGRDTRVQRRGGEGIRRRSGSRPGPGRGGRGGARRPADGPE